MIPEENSTILHDFSDKSQFQLLLRYISNHKLIFWLVVCLMILNVSLAIGAPLILNYVIEIVEDNLNGGSQQIDLNLTVALYVGLALLSWLFAVFQFIFVAKLSARFVRDLRIDAYSNLIDNKIDFFDDQKSGDLTSRIINDTKELAESSNSIAWVFTSALRVLFVVAIFLYYSPIISAVALGFLPIILGISILLGKYERRVSSIWRERFGLVNAKFQEIMSKIQISKAFNRENENLTQFHELNESTYKASRKRGFAIFIFWPISDLFKHLLTLAILAVGTWQVQEGLPIATLILFLILISYYYWPLVTIAANYHRFQGALASLERISNISFNPKLKETKGGELQPDQFHGSLEFRNVNFSYDNDIFVLKDISFQIKPGQRVALVGHTGAGKSTIASLLMQFYPITSGDIILDGHSIYNYNLHHYRSRISLVSQKVLLFKGTIRENLLLQLTTISDARIWEVLDLVQAREFIELLPNGLDSEVMENGKNLSAGQKQMISFARALLANPDLIILDEASSAVDLYTEAKISDGIDVILSNRTSISIAHRLTTIIKSDLIIVLEDGKVVETGSHEDLLTLNGKYTDMYHLYLSTQSAKYLEKIKK